MTYWVRESGLAPWELHYGLDCAQAKHAQCWDSSGMMEQAGHSRYGHDKVIVWHNKEYYSRMTSIIKYAKWKGYSRISNTTENN